MDWQLPERPAGDPKPPLDEDIAPVLARLDEWFAAHLTDPHYHFNPPSTDAELDAVEAEVGITLPNAYRQLYRWHNGENGDRWGHIYGLPIIPLDRVVSDWKTWRKVVEGFGGNRHPFPAASWPEGKIDPAYSNPRWLPLTIDGSGNSIGLDFDPWPAGRVGQIIIFGRDEDVKVVLADSLGTFLEWIAQLLESGNFRLEIGPGEEVLRKFQLKDPPANHFHEGARKLLGAPGQFL